MTHHKHHSREEIAKAEIGHTCSTPAINWFLTLFFIVLIVAVPFLQTVREAPACPQWCNVFRFMWPKPAELKAVANAEGIQGRFTACKAINDRLLRDINNYERELKDRDSMMQWLIPRMQVAITGWLRGGNEDAYCGRNGWLFYRRDIDALTGRGFLEPAVLRQRAATGSELKAPPQPDPLKGILDFRDQLAARGITLLIMPAPAKPSLYPECHTQRYEGRCEVVQNPSYEQFKQRLAKEGVALFDPAPLLSETKKQHPDLPLYLKADTHWTPPALELAAGKLAEFARQLVALPPALAGRFTVVEQPVENLGDVALMFKLPPGQRTFPPETVRIRQVLDGRNLWQPAPQAEVLFLGDSFANIYSLEPMGWGEAAGFVEHLSLALGLPVDALCRNDAGSHATREMLAKELFRGNDRLAGKKLVIWEFASRELACGDWKLVPLVLGEKKQVGFYAPEAGRTVEVRAVVRALSFAPRPGTVPYKDHILMLHLAGIESAGDPAAKGREAVVYAWSMRDNKAMPAARQRPGDIVRLRLQPWSAVSAKYDKINRSELDDDKFRLADLAWGEEIGQGSKDGSPAAGQAHLSPKKKPEEVRTAPDAALHPGANTAASTLPATASDAAGFRELCARKAADGDAMAIAGSDGWLFLRSELRHIGVGLFWGAAAAKVSKATSPDKADPLPAILDFNAQLQALGIELILAPVPCKALVYPEKMGGPATERLDTVQQQFLKMLSGKGVQVLDLAAVFMQEKAKTGSPLLYCKTDTHWSPYGCEVTAKKIKEMLGTPAWLKGKPDMFKTKPQTRTITGDLTDGQGTEELPVRAVVAPGTALEDKASPIILLGDSHTLVFHAGADLHGTGAGLADQLAAELGIAVDVIGVCGSGATPARVNLVRRVRAGPACLAGKKVVIWCFAAREFTESTGWSVLKLGK